MSIAHKLFHLNKQAEQYQKQNKKLTDKIITMNKDLDDANFVMKKQKTIIDTLMIIVKQEWDRKAELQKLVIFNYYF